MDLAIIPQKITQDATKFFNATILTRAYSHLKSSRINVSFQKGSAERYFIISGIISDGNTNTCQLSFKKLEDSDSITTTCNCSEWNAINHCSHTAALFLKFHLSKLENNTSLSVQTHSNSILQSSQAVTPDLYGEIIKDAGKFIGAPYNATFSSLQYLLRNKKTNYLPTIKDFQGKLSVRLVPAKSLEKYQVYAHYAESFVPLFFLENTSFISLFEALYIFNWENAETFHIPLKFKAFIKTLIEKGPTFEINEFLRLAAPFIDSPELDIYIEDKAFRDFSFEKPKMRMQIEKAKRNNFLQLTVEHYNSKDLLVSPPLFYQLITMEHGFLGTFRSKNDATSFTKELFDSLAYNGQEYRKKCHTSSKRGAIIDWSMHLQLNQETYIYDPIHKDVYTFEHATFVKIYDTFLQSFTEHFSRFSYYSFNEKTVYFQILKNALFQGIANLYQQMQQIQCPIFYDKNEIKSWTTNIRFERDKNNLNWFDLNLIITEKDYQIIKNAEFGENFLINNNELIILSDKEKELLKFMKKYTQVESSKMTTEANDGLKKFALHFKRARIFELFELKRHGIQGALTPEEEALCESLINLKELPKYEVPLQDRVTPRDYQVTGYQWLRFLFENKFGACLADDMGLGKTLQTIMLLQSIYPKINKALIVCPVSLLINWQNEIERFSDLPVHVYYGGNRVDTKDKKIILTSYGVMKKEAEQTFKDDHFDILIMDEVQHLKNIRSLGANAARLLNADFRICLTGTPVENDLSEFYNIMDLSIPGIWGEMSFIKTTSSKKNRLLAKQTVRPFVLRRTKAQVLQELPPKEEHHVFLNFSDLERENYIKSLARIREKIETMPLGRKYGEILKSLLELRQLCLWQSKTHIESTKIEFLMDTLEQIGEENHKSLVFSQFTTYLDIIQDKIRERGWKYTRIDGSQSLKKRGEAVEAFQNGDAQIFLISLKAGGVGLNLTAASYIFLMDPWWNPAVENQAIDRAHRIGQENKVVVYRPIIKESVEEKVMVLQNHKKELFADLMGTSDEEFFNGRLSMEDFKALLL